MNRQCVFCTIAEGGSDVSIVVQDPQTITLLDLGQFRHGHLLVAPRTHVESVQDMEESIIDAIILAVKRAVYVVDLEFPGDGVSVWQSTNDPSQLGIAHAHFHVHPRHAVEHHPDHHLVAGNTSSPTSSASVAKRLRRRMLETYCSVVDHPMTKSSWEDMRDDRHVARSRYSLWCGCSERRVE